MQRTSITVKLNLLLKGLNAKRHEHDYLSNKADYNNNDALFHRNHGMYLAYAHSTQKVKDLIKELTLTK